MDDIEAENKRQLLQLNDAKQEQQKGQAIILLTMNRK